LNKWKAPVKQHKMKKYYAWELRNVYGDVCAAFDRMDVDVVMDRQMQRFKDQANLLHEIWTTITEILDGGTR
jgi:hypothetical protein